MSRSKLLQTEIDKLLTSYSHRSVQVTFTTMRRVGFCVCGEEVVFHRTDTDHIKKLPGSKISLDLNLEARLKAQTRLLTDFIRAGIEILEKERVSAQQEEQARQSYLELLDGKLIKKHQTNLFDEEDRS